MIGTKNDCIKYMLNLDDKKQYEVKEYHEKRSLNANNYYWKLENELADKLGIDNELLHFILLQKYGQFDVVSVVATINVKPYFKYYCEAGESNLNGKLFKHYKVFKGSSEMDKREMSRLINGLVEDCKEQGIETKSEAEIKSLIESWDNK